jgi:hypothetical protein
MPSKSLSEIKKARKEQSERTLKADQKLDTTAAAAAETRKGIEKVDSPLSDVQAQLRAAKAEIAKSAEKAGADDAKVVKKQEKATKDQAKEIRNTAANSDKNKERARAVKPTDSRIRDGSDAAKILERASGELKKEASSAEKSTRDSEARRKLAEKRLQRDVSSMRKGGK